MSNNQISLSVWMADGKEPIEKMNIALPPDMPAEKLLEWLYKQAGITEKDTFHIFVGRIIRDPEDLKASLNQLSAVNGGQVNVYAPNTTQITDEREEKPVGTPAISFNQVTSPNKQPNLKILYKGEVFITISSGEEHILGRYDSTSRVNNLIDVTPYLPKGNMAFSRKQAILFDQDGRWMVRKHRDSRIGMFVNNRPVTEGQDVTLNDGDTLSVGKSLDDLALKLLIRIGD